MNNAQVASTLDTVADLLEFDGANPFRVRAYRKAVRVIGDLTESVESIHHDAARELTDVDGIGKDLAQKIGRTHRYGPTFDARRAVGPEYPPPCWI